MKDLFKSLAKRLSHFLHAQKPLTEIEGNVFYIYKILYRNLICYKIKAKEAIVKMTGRLNQTKSAIQSINDYEFIFQ